MTVDVIAAAADVTPECVEGRTVVVIDVLRATSVMVSALSAGASAIWPTMSVDEALRLKTSLMAGGHNALLGGERNAVKIDGFDLDNSPRAYTHNAVSGRDIIFTTTNGTLAVRRSVSAGRVLIGSINNVSAVIRAIASSSEDIVLVCSGREGHFTLEDTLCAGMIADGLTMYGASLTDLAWVSADMYSRYSSDITALMSHCIHYNNIMKRGFGTDIEYCLRKDTHDVVPYLCGDRIII